MEMTVALVVSIKRCAIEGVAFQKSQAVVIQALNAEQSTFVLPSL